MKKIVILDYSVSKVFVKKIPKELENKQMEETEKWLVENNFKLSQIEWMFGDLEIVIE